MASESNEPPLSEHPAKEDEDQFADSVADDGLSPDKVFNQKVLHPMTTTVMDETSTVDATMDVVYTPIGDLNTKSSLAKKSDDERGAQQSKGAAKTRTSGPKKDYETTNQSTIVTKGADFTNLPQGVPLPAVPKLPREFVPLPVIKKFSKMPQQGSEIANPPRGARVPPLSQAKLPPPSPIKESETAKPPRGARLPPLSQAELPPPPNTATKPANVPVIPISWIETQVCKAARLVAVELSCGGWPEAQPGACVKASAAIEEFAKVAFLPNLMLRGGQQHDSTEASNERIFLATMLALREVLTQNAYRIFQMQDVSRDDKEQKQADESKPGSKRQKRLDYREERQYMAQLFGTGVIIASLQSLPEAESLISSFSGMTDAYDTCSEEFASRMNCLDGRHQGVTLNGKTLKNEENVAWKVSYNRARELHPVVCRNGRRTEQRSEPSHVVQIPKPNALFVSMVEECAKKQRL